MASSALNLLSGIAAAAAGLAGEKVSKSGDIPGFDLAAIVPALLGKKADGKAAKVAKVAGIAGKVASAVAKSGVLKNTKLEKLGNMAELADSLFSSDGETAKGKASATGIAGLAAAIVGGTGSGTNLASIAASALKLGKTAKDEKGLVSMATQLGGALSKAGISFNGSSAAIKALGTVMEGDTKTKLLQTILKGIS